jgi:hypothetical protein
MPLPAVLLGEFNHLLGLDLGEPTLVLEGPRQVEQFDRQQLRSRQLEFEDPGY